MFDIVRSISFFLLILCFVLFLSRYKIENKTFKIYTAYLGLIVFIESLIRVIIYFGYQNLIFSHLYFTGQFIFLSLFYLNLMKEDYQKKIIKFNLFFIPSVVVINFFINPSEIHQFSLLEIILTSLSLIIYSVMHFYNLLSHKKEYYYINCGILIYLLGSTVSFLPRNLYVIYGRPFSNFLHNLNIVLYILYLIFILVEWRQFNSKTKG